MVLKTAIKNWTYVGPLVTRPKTKKEYEQLVKHLEELLDIVGDDSKHQLNGLVDIISNLIKEYEDEHYPEPKGRGVDALRYLIEIHQLHQTDLAEIASQGVISEILSGKRKLTLRQINLLAKRFGVSAETFID